MFSYRLLNLYALVLCIASLLFAILYLEQTLYLDPCPLCVLDRVVIFGLGVIFLLALLHNSKSFAAIIYGIFCTILSVIGVLLAARHIWLQNLPEDQVPECGPDIYFMLETLPIFEVLKSVLTGSGSCAEVSWTFAGLTIPEQTLILFVVLLVLSVIQTIRPRKSV